MPNLPDKAQTYKLKAMVMLRLLSELAALLILVVLPVVLLVLGQFSNLHLFLRITVSFLSLLACGLVIAYGYLPWKVIVDSSGLETVSLFKRQKQSWNKMRTIKLKTSWGWRRYVLTYDGGQLSFPFWLMNVQELLEIIRSCLPGQGKSNFASKQSYKLDNISLVLQLGRAFVQLVFITVFWFFWQSLASPGSPNPAHPSHPASQTDLIFILLVGVVFTLVMLWRFYMIASMPHFVEVSDEGFFAKGWLKSSNFQWQDITSLQAPFVILPEGIMVKAGKKSLLIGSDLDSFDELQEELQARIKVPDSKKS